MSAMVSPYRTGNLKLYCLLLTALAVVNSVKGIPCPESTEYQFPGTCRLRLIHVSGTPVSYDQIIANRMCGYCNAYPVEPTTPELDELVEQTITKYNENAKASISSVWIGATRRVKQSETFRWKHADFNAGNPKYSNFAEGEPRSGTSDDGYYCLYWSSTGWRAASCHEPNRPVLCQTIGCEVPLKMELTRGGNILQNDEIVHSDSQHQAIELTCMAHGTSPLYVEWFRDKVKVENAKTKNEAAPQETIRVFKTITVHNSDHGHEYRCDASYESGLMNTVTARVCINNDCSEEDNSNSVSGNPALVSSSPGTSGSDTQDPGNPAHSFTPPGNSAHRSVAPGNQIHRSTISSNPVQGTVDPGNSTHRPTSSTAVKTTTFGKRAPQAEKITENYGGISATVLATLIISGIAALLIGFGTTYVILRKREQQKPKQDAEVEHAELESGQSVEEISVDRQIEKPEEKYDIDDAGVDDDDIYDEINDDIDDGDENDEDN